MFKKDYQVPKVYTDMGKDYKLGTVQEFMVGKTISKISYPQSNRDYIPCEMLIEFTDGSAAYLYGEGDPGYMGTI